MDRFGINISKYCFIFFEFNIKIRRDEGKFLSDLRFYRVFVGSLIYLIIIRSDILFSVGFVSRYM